MVVGHSSHIQVASRPSMLSGRALQAFQASARALRSSLPHTRSPGTAEWMPLSPRGRTFATRAKTTSSSDTSDLQAKKAKALQTAMKEINLKCGHGTIMHLGHQSQDDKQVTTPTGALTLDYAVGGGYPEGRIIEIFGAESTGKSTLALHAMAEVQKQGKQVVLIDSESAFNRDFAESLGITIEDFTIVQATTGEDVFYTIEKLVCSEAVSMICVDSVAAMLPRSELEGEVGQPTMGVQARLMSQGLRKITGLCHKHKTTVIFLNQTRNKIQAYGNPETTTGGLALKFYSSIRLKLTRAKTPGPSLDQNGEDRGIRVKVTVVKNKCAPPSRTAEFDILWASGISSTGCILDVAEKVGVVTKRGSWFSYQDSNLAQGRDKVIALLEDDTDLRSKIEAETRQKLTNSDASRLLEQRSSQEHDLDEAEEEIAVVGE